MARKPDFAQFRRAFTTPDSRPVSIGGIYEDAETMYRYLGKGDVYFPKTKPLPEDGLITYPLFFQQLTRKGP